MKRGRFKLAVLGVLLSPLAGLAAADTNPPAVTQVTLKLADGGRVTGTPTGAVLPFHMDYAKTEIPWNVVGDCEISSNSASVLKLKNGDQLRGRVGVEALKLETALGKLNVSLAAVTGFQARSGRSGNILDGLVLYFPFDEDNGDIVHDASENGNNGKVVGSKSVVAGKIGDALKVGRGCGCIEVAANSVWSFGGEPFSLALWINHSTNLAKEQMIIGCSDGGGYSNWKWSLEFYKGRLGFHLNAPQRPEQRIIDQRVATTPWRGKVGQWYHIALTRNVDEYRLYVNGVCLTRDVNTNPVTVVSAPLTIGQVEGLFFEGAVDEVMIFNRALSPEEIMALSQREGPLAAAQPAGQAASGPLKARAELVDGSVVVGELKDEAIGVQAASLGKVTAPLALLRELKFSEEGKKVAAKLRNGDLLVGTPLVTSLNLTTAFGRVTLTPLHLRAVQLGHEKTPPPPAAAPPRPAPASPRERTRIIEL